MKLFYSMLLFAVTRSVYASFVKDDKHAEFLSQQESETSDNVILMLPLVEMEDVSLGLNSDGTGFSFDEFYDDMVLDLKQLSNSDIEQCRGSESLKLLLLIQRSLNYWRNAKKDANTIDSYGKLLKVAKQIRRKITIPTKRTMLIEPILQTSKLVEVKTYPFYPLLSKVKRIFRREHTELLILFVIALLLNELYVYIKTF